MTKEWLLSKTNGGSDIIQHIIRKEFPDHIMHVKGQDCGDCPDPVWADGSIIEVTLDRIPVEGTKMAEYAHATIIPMVSCSTVTPLPSPRLTTTSAAKTSPRNSSSPAWRRNSTFRSLASPSSRSRKNRRPSRNRRSPNSRPAPG